MRTLFKIVWYDKKTEYMVGQKDITDLVSEKEIKLLLNESNDLYGCYPLSKLQIQHLEYRLDIDLSEDYDYFLEFPGDWILDKKDTVWIPAPASEFTDKSPITHEEADEAFASNDPEKIKDALIRTVFFDDNPQRIQQKCLIYLDSEHPDLQREAIIGLGHLARIHGKLDKKLVVNKLKNLEKNSNFREEVEDTLDCIEEFLDVKRRE